MYGNEWLLMIRIDYIREFVKLAECLSFTETAAALYTSQPSVSRHVSEIEQALGATLVRRNTRGCELTASGVAVYHDFREIVSRYDHAVEQTRLMSQGFTGQLTISSPYYWTTDYVEQNVLRFRKLHPGVQVTIISCQPNEGLLQLKRGESDLAMFMMFDTTDPEICYKPFATEPLSVVLSKDHPLASRRSLSLDELVGERFIMLDHGRSHVDYERKVLLLLQAHGISTDDLVRTQQVDTIGMTILETGGMCIQPNSIRHLDREYLRTVPLTDEGCDITLCYCHRFDTTNEAVSLFYASLAMG